jgi:alcohol dehydrogenase
VLQKGGGLAARADMLLGAALGGLAIENSMLGAAHAAANPLTAHFHLAHGQAVGLMLPAVIRFNAAEAQTARLYDELGEATAAGLAAKVEWLLNLAGMPRSLAECPVTPSDIPMLAAEAARQWTAGFNPRPVGEKDFAQLYEAALAPRGPGAP